MNIKEFKTSKGEFLGVLVPDDANCWIGKYRGTNVLYYGVKPTSHYALGKGQYKIIGIKNEITEEQAKEIVDFPAIRPKYGDPFQYTKAIEVFNSLMQKLEIKPDTKTLIIQKIK